jgi:hypothetical protein
LRRPFCFHRQRYTLFTILSPVADNFPTEHAQIGGMKNKLFGLALAGIGFAYGLQTPILACGPINATSVNSLVQQAVSADETVSASAMAALRAKGPSGLEALLKANTASIRFHETNTPPASKKEASWKRLQTALDAVSGQHDCCASHLYWYTDLEQAKVAAKASGKPILSLRLLGRLDEEYSCANSRFFRTTLYANTEVSQYLRDHFVLHWKSVRPVPRITIDFGDGRKIERTITGNSIHYVLDSEGQPVDGLPGLYGTKAFLKTLAVAEQAALQSARLSGDSRERHLRWYHGERLADVSTEWKKDLTLIGVKSSAGAFPKGNSSPSVPTALEASRVAVSKSGGEVPVLRSFAIEERRSMPAAESVDDATWARLAALHKDDATLDWGAQALIRMKNPTAFEASTVTASKRVVENPFLTAMRNLQRSIAEDTVRNEYLLHLQIHRWFAQGNAPKDLDQLNAKVYAELFLTPDSDPWLGLAPANAFTGLDNEGLIQAARKP